MPIPRITFYYLYERSACGFPAPSGERGLLCVGPDAFFTLFIFVIPIVVAVFFFLERKAGLGLILGLLLIVMMELIYWGQPRIVSSCMPWCPDNSDCWEKYHQKRRQEALQREFADQTAIPAGVADFLIVVGLYWLLSRRNQVLAEAGGAPPREGSGFPIGRFPKTDEEMEGKREDTG